MLRAGLGIGDAEAPAVLQRRHGLAGGLNLRGVDLGKKHAGLDAAFGENLAPGGDDQRMPEGLTLVLVHAALRRGEDEATGLDGAGAQQRVPMRLAGLSGEG